MCLKNTFISSFILLSVCGGAFAFRPLELNVTAKVGAKMRLPCRVPPGTQENVIQWYIGKKQLTFGMVVLQFTSRLMLNKPAPNEINLIIKSVVRSDEDVFTCRSHTQVFARVGVLVEWKPQIIDEESSKTQKVMVEGSDGQLKCTASGQPTPNVTWHRRSQDENMFTPIGVTGDILTIRSITRYGSDVYMCNASNTQGWATWEMNVTVHFPVEVEIYETDMAVGVGELVVMTCVIQGSPLYDFYWKFNNVKVVENWKYMLHTQHDNGYPVYFLTLLIREGTLGEFDFGTYTCHADGSGSEAEKAIQLTEKKKEELTEGGAGYSVIN